MWKKIFSRNESPKSGDEPSDSLFGVLTSSSRSEDLDSRDEAVSLPPSSLFLGSSSGHSVPTFRILVLGPRGVGKTSLLRSLIHEELQTAASSRRLRLTSPTVCAKCCQHFLPHRKMIFEYCDTETNQRFASFIRHMHLSEAHSLLLLYDSSSRESLSKALEIFHDIVPECQSDDEVERFSDDEDDSQEEEEPSRPSVVFLVGTQADVVPRRGSRVTPEEAVAEAIQSGVLLQGEESRHHQVSVVTGTGLWEFFEQFQNVMETLRSSVRVTEPASPAIFQSSLVEEEPEEILEEITRDAVSPPPPPSPVSAPASPSHFVPNEVRTAVTRFRRPPLKKQVSWSMLQSPAPSPSDDPVPRSLPKLRGPARDRVIASLSAAPTSGSLSGIDLSQRKFAPVRRLIETILPDCESLLEALSRKNAKFENHKAIAKLFTLLRKRKVEVDEIFAGLRQARDAASDANAVTSRTERRRSWFGRKSPAQLEESFMSWEWHCIRSHEEKFRTLFRRCSTQELEFNAKCMAIDYGDLYYRGQWNDSTWRFHGLGKLYVRGRSGGRNVRGGVPGYVLSYFGEFYQGKKMGTGREYHEDGVTVSYYGRFFRGKRHGQGHQFDRNGETVQRGEWDNGRFTSCFTSQPVLELDMTPYRTQMIRDENFIGRGSFANVYRLEIEGIGVCAFKHFPGRLEEEGMEMLKRELFLASNLDFPNVIKIVGVSYDSPVGILAEFCNTSVAKLIRKQPTTRVRKLSVDDKLDLLYDTALGMEFLNLHHVLHRDLKWQNVLIKRSQPADLGQIKIIDFGLSKMIESFRFTPTAMSRVGTSLYMAPEVYKGQSGYTAKCDVYSFAVMIYEMLFDTLDPYKIKARQVFPSSIEFQVVQQGLRPEIPEDYSPSPDWLIELMEQCWDADAEVRPSFTQILDRFVGNRYRPRVFEGSGGRSRRETFPLSDSDGEEDEEEGEAEIVIEIPLSEELEEEAEANE